MRRAGGPVIYDVHKVYAILDTLLLLRADLEVRIHAMSSLKLLLGVPPPPTPLPIFFGTPSTPLLAEASGRPEPEKVEHLSRKMQKFL